MVSVGGVGRVPGRVPEVGRKARDGGAFRVPAGEAAAASGVGVVSMPGLLGLQEAESGAVQDREARRDTEAVLQALGEMQRDLLGGAPGAGLERLERLAERARPAMDPGLAEVQRAVLLRAAVERARRGSAAQV